MQAILITAYKNFEHLKNLVDFFDESYSVYIHIDQKSEVPAKYIEYLDQKSTVRLISREFNINWGGVNHLNAILLLAREALKDKSNIAFHLITGHDYPIKNLEEFNRFHFVNGTNSYMEYFPLPFDSWPRGGIDRLSRYNINDYVDGRKGLKKIFVEGVLKLQRIFGITRKFSDKFPKLYGGSTYWTLSRDCVEYVFKYMDAHPDFKKRFDYSFCSEEIFFQTVLLNSPLKDNIIQDNLRFIVWEVRNGNFPANLDMRDFEDITKSKALFARKFEFPVSSELLSKINQKIK